jgi:hypothetical protein
MKVSLWDRKSQITRSPRVCRARAKIQVSSKEEEITSHSQILFSWAKQKSNLIIKFLSPFRTTVAELKMDFAGGTWTDESGEVSLRSRPTFAEFFRQSWWEDLGFVFGLLSPDLSAGVYFDEQNRPVRFQRNTRTIDCTYVDEPPYSKSCQISDLGLNARLDFAFMDCDS